MIQHELDSWMVFSNRPVYINEDDNDGIGINNLYQIINLIWNTLVFIVGTTGYLILQRLRIISTRVGLN